MCEKCPDLERLCKRTKHAEKTSHSSSHCGVLLSPRFQVPFSRPHVQAGMSLGKVEGEKASASACYADLFHPFHVARKEMSKSLVLGFQQRSGATVLQSESKRIVDFLDKKVSLYSTSLVPRIILIGRKNNNR